MHATCTSRCLQRVHIAARRIAQLAGRLMFHSQAECRRHGARQCRKLAEPAPRYRLGRERPNTILPRRAVSPPRYNTRLLTCLRVLSTREYDINAAPGHKKTRYTSAAVAAGYAGSLRRRLSSGDKRVTFDPILSLTREAKRPPSSKEPSHKCSEPSLSRRARLASEPLLMLIFSFLLR